LGGLSAVLGRLERAALWEDPTSVGLPLSAPCEFLLLEAEGETAEAGSTRCFGPAGAEVLGVPAAEPGTELAGRRCEEVEVVVVVAAVEPEGSGRRVKLPVASCVGSIGKCLAAASTSTYRFWVFLGAVNKELSVVSIRSVRAEGRELGEADCQRDLATAGTRGEDCLELWWFGA
jgi:hypothetical protein